MYAYCIFIIYLLTRMCVYKKAINARFWNTWTVSCDKPRALYFLFHSSPPDLIKSYVKAIPSPTVYFLLYYVFVYTYIIFIYFWKYIYLRNHLSRKFTYYELVLLVPMFCYFIITYVLNIIPIYIKCLYIFSFIKV